MRTLNIFYVGQSYDLAEELGNRVNSHQSFININYEHVDSNASLWVALQQAVDQNTLFIYDDNYYDESVKTQFINYLEGLGNCKKVLLNDGHLDQQTPGFDMYICTKNTTEVIENLVLKTAVELNNEHTYSIEINVN